MSRNDANLWSILNIIVRCVMNIILLQNMPMGALYMFKLLQYLPVELVTANLGDNVR